MDGKKIQKVRSTLIFLNKKKTQPSLPDNLRVKWYLLLLLSSFTALINNDQISTSVSGEIKFFISKDGNSYHTFELLMLFFSFLKKLCRGWQTLDYVESICICVCTLNNVDGFAHEITVWI